MEKATPQEGLNPEEIVLDAMNQPASDPMGAKEESATQQRGLAILFAGFRLEADGSFFRGGSALHLPPRELAALRLLIEYAGQIVTPGQLKQSLWGDVHVSPDSVPKCLSSLRAHLHPADCIQTVYKRGYRFAAEIRTAEPASLYALPRLAIPPFVSEAGIPDHLGAAVAEEAIARLSNARTPFASILARDSIFTLAARGLSAVQIGESLHADLVLAGTLRPFHSFVRLRAEMIRVSDGVQLWAEDLLIDPDRIAGMDSELAIHLDYRLRNWRVNQSLNLAHGPQPESLSAPRPAHPGASTGSASESISLSAAAETAPATITQAQHREAYRAFLRGHHEWQTLERHRMQDGQQHLTRAIELDPELIAAKVDMAHLCVTQAFYGFMPPALANRQARLTAESIADFVHRAPAVLPVVGWGQFHFEHDLQGALRAFNLSAHLSHDPWVARIRIHFALSRHRFTEAIEMIRAAIQDDPYSPWLAGHLAWALHLDGQAQPSLEQIEQCLREFPSDAGVILYGAMILAFNGEQARALQLAADLAQRQPQFDLATVMHAYTLACSGLAAEARAVLERVQWLSKERFVLKSFTPAVHVALGDPDSAIAELHAANDARCPWFFQMLADPRLKPLHGRPDFARLAGILRSMEDAAHRQIRQN